jgi:hypothetical protein
VITVANCERCARIFEFFELRNGLYEFCEENIKEDD